MKNRFYILIPLVSILLFLAWYFLLRSNLSETPELASGQAPTLSKLDVLQKRDVVTKALMTSAVGINDYQSSNTPVVSFINGLSQKYILNDPSAIDALIDINALCDQNTKKKVADQKKPVNGSQDQAAVWNQIDSYCRGYTPLFDSADPSVEEKRALGLTSKLQAEYAKTRTEKGYNALSTALAQDVFSQDDPHKIEIALQYASENGIPIKGLEWLNKEAYTARIDPEGILYRAGTLNRCTSANGCQSNSYTALAHCVSTITCQSPISYEKWLSQNTSPVEYAYIKRVIAQIRK